MCCSLKNSVMSVLYVSSFEQPCRLFPSRVNIGMSGLKHGAVHSVATLHLPQKKGVAELHLIIYMAQTTVHDCAADYGRVISPEP